MIRFLIRRLTIIPFILVLIHFLGFAYAHLVRPLRALRNPYLATTLKPAPLLTAYRNYLVSLLHLDFGTMPDPWNQLREVPFLGTVFHAAEASFGLLSTVLVLCVIVGVLIGILASQTEPPRIAPWLTSIATFGLSMPTFFLGSLFFAFWFLYVIWGGMGVLPLPISGFGWDLHLVVPALVLMARPTVQIALITAGLLNEELGKQYVVAARSYGHTWRSIHWRQALRNILAPVVLTIAASVRLLVGELIVVEWLFEWPGIGNLLARTLIPARVVLVRTLTDRPLFLDPPLVAFILVAFASLFMFIDLIASILVRTFDPRLRDV